MWRGCGMVAAPAGPDPVAVALNVGSVGHRTTSVSGRMNQPVRVVAKDDHLFNQRIGETGSYGIDTRIACARYRTSIARRRGGTCKSSECGTTMMQDPQCNGTIPRFATPNGVGRHGDGHSRPGGDRYQRRQKFRGREAATVGIKNRVRVWWKKPFRFAGPVVSPVAVSQTQGRSVRGRIKTTRSAAAVCAYRIANG